MRERLYYYNTVTLETQREHPLDAHHRQLYEHHAALMRAGGGSGSPVAAPGGASPGGSASAGSPHDASVSSVSCLGAADRKEHGVARTLYGWIEVCIPHSVACGGHGSRPPNPHDANGCGHL